jgi:hypothetical protein
MHRHLRSTTNRWLDGRRDFKLPGLAVNFVKQERSIDALPEVTIFNGNDSTEPFPLPIIRPPFGKTHANAAAHIAAFGDECHPRWAI